MSSKKNQGTDQFKLAIETYLNKRAQEDHLFAETLKKPNKSIEECMNYIFEEVKKSQHIGFADQEIYDMAVHYYDEDDVKPTGTFTPRVIVNYIPEITQEEKDAAKQKAIDDLVQEQRNKMLKKSKPKPKVVDPIIVKKDEAIPVEKTVEGPVQGSLF